MPVWCPTPHCCWWIVCWGAGGLGRGTHASEIEDFCCQNSGWSSWQCCVWCCSSSTQMYGGHASSSGRSSCCSLSYPLSGVASRHVHLRLFCMPHTHRGAHGVWVALQQGATTLPACLGLLACDSLCCVMWACVFGGIIRVVFFAATSRARVDVPASFNTYGGCAGHSGGSSSGADVWWL